MIEKSHMGRPVAGIVIILALIILGAAALGRLPVEFLPDASLPLFFLSISLPEPHPPELIERNLAEDVDKMLLRMPGVEKAETFIDRLSLWTRIELNRKTDRNLFYHKLTYQVRKLIADKSDWQDINYSIRNIAYQDTILAELIIKSDMDRHRLRNVVDALLTPHLEKIHGIGQITVYGGQKVGVEFSPDPIKIQSLNLSPHELAALLRRYAGRRPHSIGNVESGDLLIPAKWIIPSVHADNVENTHIHYAPHNFIPLQQLGNIEKINFDAESINRIDGKRFIYLDIHRKNDADLRKTALNLKNALPSILEEINKKSAGKPMEIDFYFDAADELYSAVKYLAAANIVGILLVLLLFRLFFKSMITALMLVSIILISLMTLFNIMYLTGLSFNVLTLCGTAVGLGLLIDNAVIILDNLLNRRKISELKRRSQSFLETFSGIIRPLTASNLTTLIVFIPLLMSRKSTHILLKPALYTVAALLIVSLPISLTVVYLYFCRFQFKAYKKTAFDAAGLDKKYIRRLTSIIRNRHIFILSAVFIFIALTVLLLPHLQLSILRTQRKNEITASFETFSDADLIASERYAAQTEELLLDKKEIESVRTVVFPGRFDLILRIAEKYQNPEKLIELREMITELPRQTPGIKLMLNPPNQNENGYDSFYPFKLRISGYPGKDMTELIKIFRTMLSNYKPTFPVDKEKEFFVLSLDPEKILGSNIDLKQLNEDIKFHQKDGLLVCRLESPDGTEILPLRMVSRDSKHESLSAAEAMQAPVVVYKGRRIDLNRTGYLTRETMSSNIYHFNGIRRLEIPIVFPPASLPTGASLNGLEKHRKDLFLKKVRKTLDCFYAPGSSAELIETREEQKQKTRKQNIDMLKVILAAAVLIYIILASAYESASWPLLVMLIIPAALAGAVWSLVLTMMPLNEITYLSFYLLLGITVNNSIVMLDRMRLNMSRGSGRASALLYAARDRIKPILLMSGTTMLAVFPLLFQKSIWRPFAVSLIGGMLSAAFTALFLIPAIIYAADDIKNLKKYLSRRKQERKQDLTRIKAGIEVRNLTKIYPDGTQAVSNINISIQSGMLGLLGPNGAGKSTLMRMIAGEIKPTLGTVRIAGLPAEQYPYTARRLTGCLPQDFDFYESFTPKKLLDYWLIMNGENNPETRKLRIRNILKAVELSDAADRKVDGFSGGMKRRLGVALTLVRQPPVLIIDEPTVGLDPESRVKFRNMIGEMARNSTVILSTHIVEDVQRTCRKVAVMNKSEIVFSGTVDRLIKMTEGKVYEVTVDDRHIQSFKKQYRILTKKRIPEGIKCRLLAEQKPAYDAVTIKPNLEDAYVYMLSKSQDEHGGEGNNEE